MNPINTLIEQGKLPDFLIRYGIRKRLSKTIRDHVPPTAEQQREAIIKHANDLRKSPIAIHTDDANTQHYEVPSRFYECTLGARLKYSSAWFDSPEDSLDQAEEKMLTLTCQRANIADGQKILELGCGWGSLTLWIAEHYPNAHITAISNSSTQKQHIDAQAQARGLKNITIRTANMVNYEGEEQNQFDRVVSVEMFEHMKNYAKLMQRISTWLKPEGFLFLHIFTHRTAAYHYEVRSDDDWMSKHFFTGGQMPSNDLLLYFQDHLTIRNHWCLNGSHYQRTSEAWLKNMDAHRAEIMPLFETTYGQDQALKWWNYWRIFFMACAELWGYQKGEEWIVSHYLFQNPKAPKNDF